MNWIQSCGVALLLEAHVLTISLMKDECIPLATIACFISFRSVICMGSHVYSLTTLGYLVPDALSDDITRKAGRTLGKLSWSLLCTDEATFSLCTFCPWSSNLINSSFFLNHFTIAFCKVWISYPVFCSNVFIEDSKMWSLSSKDNVSSLDIIFIACILPFWRDILSVNLS